MKTQETTDRFAGHTPGPWKADENGIVVGGKDCRTSICDAYVNAWRDCNALSGANESFNRSPDYYESGRVTAEANARLIAAAPSLLAENKRLREACDYALNMLIIKYNGGKIDLEQSSWKKTLNMLRAALAASEVQS